MSTKHTPGPYCTSTPETARADWLSLASIRAKAALRDHHTAMRLGYSRRTSHGYSNPGPLCLAYRNTAWLELQGARAAIAAACEVQS